MIDFHQTSISPTGLGTRCSIPTTDTCWRRASPEPARRRLLLVDDDAAVLEVIGELLQESGYDVVSAASGEEALDLLARSNPFDVVVTDYAMPGITGRELVARARRLYPHVPAVLVTGFAGGLAMQDLPHGVLVVRKPFALADLVRSVQHSAALMEAVAATLTAGFDPRPVAGAQARA